MQDSNKNENDEPALSSMYTPETDTMRDASRRRRTGFFLARALLVVCVFGLGMLSGCQVWGSGVASERTQGQPPPTTGSAVASDLDAIREEVVNKVRPSVVQINVALLKGRGTGSGVIVDRRGYIITNYHVIAGAQQIHVVFAEGTVLPAQITGTAPADDLAVVKVDPSKVRLTVATYGDSSKLQVGQEVLAIGNPLGITQTVTNGIVSALDRNVRTGQDGQVLPGTIQTDAPINPGNSGGALVDLQGNLVGVPTLTAIDPEFNTPANGVGFAIPSNRARFISTQLINSGKVTSTGRAALGIQGADVTPAFAAQNDLRVDHGILITRVTPNGPAAKAGLKPGDIIVQVDNTAVSDTAALSDALLSKKPGDQVAVKIYRGNQQLTVKVTLGELAAP